MKALIIALAMLLFHANGFSQSKYCESEYRLCTVIIPIGEWDMDSSSAVIVSHSISSHLNIRAAIVMIINDGSITMFPLDSYSAASSATQGGVVAITPTHIVLERLTGGNFDDVSFGGLGFNRGWITITYEL